MAIEFDVPVFKKCCFCIPLRRGLLVWGYLKLLANLILILLFGWITLAYIQIMRRGAGVNTMVVCILLMSIFVINLLFTIMFLIGAHTKNEKLVRVYYKFSIGFLIFNAIIVFGVVIYKLKEILSAEEMNSSDKARLTNAFTKDLIAYLFDMIMQGYLLMLIRSQLFKLRGSHNFEFVNNAETGATAACNMIVTIAGKK